MSETTHTVYRAFLLDCRRLQCTPGRQPCQVEVNEGFEVLHEDLPELLAPRQLTGHHPPNWAGRLLYDLAQSGPLITTTGRGYGDKGRPTCRNTTRTEHILMDPTLYKTPTRETAAAITTLDAAVGSDHVPLQLSFTEPANIYNIGVCHHDCYTQHKCHQGQCCSLKLY